MARSANYIRHLTDDFQRLVEAIAFFYVLCQLPMMIECVIKGIGPDLHKCWITILSFCAHVFSSTFNLPLYLLFSRKIRKTFFQILRDVCKRNDTNCVARLREEVSYTSSARHNMEAGAGRRRRGAGSRGESTDGRNRHPSMDASQALVAHSV